MALVRRRAGSAISASHAVAVVANLAIPAGGSVRCVPGRHADRTARGTGRLSDFARVAGVAGRTCDAGDALARSATDLVDVANRPRGSGLVGIDALGDTARTLQ